MIEAYKAFWKSSFDFKGRTRRADFWLAIFAINIVLFAFVIAGLLFVMLVGDFVTVAPFTIVVAYSIVTIVPSISIQVRRLRDAGFSPWLLLLALVPYVGLVLFVMYLQPSKAVLPE